MSVLLRQIASGSSRTQCLSCQKRWNVAGLSRRRLHDTRPLPYPIEDGVGDFLPPPALRTVVEWQQGLIQRLNEQVKGTPHEHQSVVQTILDTYPDQEKTLAFNYASLALNNSFFLEHLKPPPSGEQSNEKGLASDLFTSIRHQFGSLDHMKSTFAASALGISSSGWIWLVTDGESRLAVLPTFGAGTLLVRSRNLVVKHPRGVIGEDIMPSAWGAAPSASRPGPREATLGTDTPASGLRTNPLPPFADSASTPSSPTTGMRSAPPPLNPFTPSRALHSTAPSTLDAPTSSLYGGKGFGANPRSTEALHFPKQLYNNLGTKLYPLLCISVHEHAWLSAGLGVWGQEEYLKRFWNVVNWEQVSESFRYFSSRTL